MSAGGPACRAARSRASRAALANLKGPWVFAHSDLSGMSLFEEANYAGVRAADLA